MHTYTHVRTLGWWRKHIRTHNACENIELTLILWEWKFDAKGGVNKYVFLATYTLNIYFYAMDCFIFIYLLRK